MVKKSAGMGTTMMGNRSGYGGSPGKVAARPTLRTYRESVGPATSNKTTSGKPKGGGEGRKSSC